MAIVGSRIRPGSTERRSAPEWVQTSLVVAGVTACAAAVGALYAAIASSLDDPRVVPIAAAALVALVVGLWRLEYGLALMIVVTPFAENAPISQPSEARLRVALVLWALTLVAIQAGRTLVSEQRLRPPPMFAGVVTFLVVGLISVVVARDGGAAAAKFLLFAGSVVVYLLIAMFLTDWQRLRPVLAAFLVIGLVISVHALYQYAVGDLSRVGFVSTGGRIEYRIASVFSHPNQLAGFLVLFVPLAGGLFWALESRTAKVASAALFVFAVPAVVFTYSRGALVALAALALVYARDVRAWPVIGLAAVLVALVAPSVLAERLADTGSLERPEIATRVDVFRAAGTMFEEHPVAGVGLHNFESAYVELERPGRSFLPGTDFGVPETAHNLYLNTLAEQGLLGLGALLILALAVARPILALQRSDDRRIRAMGGALLGVGIVLAVHNAFDVTFLDPKTSTAVWALFGIAAALYRLEETQRRTAGGDVRSS